MAQVKSTGSHIGSSSGVLCIVRWCALVALGSVSVASFGALTDPPAAEMLPAPYLSGPYAKLNFQLPPLPSDADVLELELDQVRAAQFADRSAKEEAFADADAYLSDQLLERFSVVAGETLTRSRRPILAHMIRRA